VAAAPGFVRRPAAVPTFVYGGRLAPVKGIDLLLRAFARVVDAIPEARLRIYGDGQDRAPLVALSTRLGLDDVVEWQFGMRKEWMEDITDAWAVVVPSRFREPLGLVAIEAILRGLPVIAADGGGLRASVRRAAGRWVGSRPCP